MFLIFIMYDWSYLEKFCFVDVFPLEINLTWMNSSALFHSKSRSSTFWSVWSDPRIFRAGNVSHIWRSCFPSASEAKQNWFSEIQTMTINGIFEKEYCLKSRAYKPIYLFKIQFFHLWSIRFHCVLRKRIIHNFQLTVY